ncbi:MAG: YebC/PmpR family DNA-binding transcriptional regulator [Armatimonadetes bacterium]|nr:YebC/PmpR family DNA-binding transcriptional regulator [Armatimonadota bacterium]
MAGHSKWHNIRIRKGKQDALRGKLFTKLAREITIASRDGGGIPESNPRLRLAVQKAKEASMPADNIKRAIQKGTGEIADVQYEEVLYEGYGPGGVAIIVQCMTDNKNRTVSEIRHLLSKYGGNMADAGSVSWQFQRQGTILIPQNGATEEQVIEIALEAGAEDVKAEDGAYVVITGPDAFYSVRQSIEDAGVSMESAELGLAPTNLVQVSGDTAEKLLRLLDMLEEHDDVQSVSANFDMPDEALSA